MVYITYHESRQHLFSYFFIEAQGPCYVAGFLMPPGFGLLCVRVLGFSKAVPAGDERSAYILVRPPLPAEVKPVHFHARPGTSGKRPGTLSACSPLERFVTFPGCAPKVTMQQTAPRPFPAPPLPCLPGAPSVFQRYCPGSATVLPP